MRWIMVVALLCWGAAAMAWEEPARGTKTRADLMDAIRPHVEWMLGAPVQFVVNDLRRDGNIAYAELKAQRPGGAPIVLENTPAYRRGDYDYAIGMDISLVYALYRKSGDTWVAVHYQMAPGDGWPAEDYDALCREYYAVICQ